MASASGIFGVEVVTPERALVSGPTKAVVLATSIGSLTVLDGHTPLVGDVAPGEVRVEGEDGNVVHLAVHGGFVQVHTAPGAARGLADEGDGPFPGMSTRVTILTGIAELSSEIDVERAERARDAATDRLASLRQGGERVGAAGGVGGAGTSGVGGTRSSSDGTRDDGSGHAHGESPRSSELAEAESALERATLRLMVASSASTH